MLDLLADEQHRRWWLESPQHCIPFAVTTNSSRVSYNITYPLRKKIYIFIHRPNVHTRNTSTSLDVQAEYCICETLQWLKLAKCVTLMCRYYWGLEG